MARVICQKVQNDLSKGIAKYFSGRNHNYFVISTAVFAFGIVPSEMCILQ